MIAALRTPARRIAFAIALSALIHGAILWLPHIQLPRDKVQLPPLTARLEPLPKPVAQPAAKPESANSVTRPDDSASALPASGPANAADKVKEPAATHLFPTHIQLIFAVYKGADSFRIGESRHQLDLHGNRYTMKAVKRAAGLTSLRNGDQFIQTSYGKIGEHGLQPETFKEERITAGGKQNLKAAFDWATQKLHFSHGGEAALPADTQDALSFMYQLSQLPLTNREYFPLPISDGTRLEQCRVETGGTEDISTPMGNLRALHLRKMHSYGEAYFEIWLGLEHRLLPVKFRQVDSSNKVTEEFVISDIRIADK